MIVEEGKYYLYRHVRLDKNEPFYIGIGTKQKSDPYLRAKDHLTKNNIWKKITSKTDYIVEIILESDDDNFIQEKEKEFISLYGRLCENNGGILSNIESGGRKGAINFYSCKKIYCCTNQKWYNSIKEASIDLNLNPSTISRNLSGETFQASGYIFSEIPCPIFEIGEEWFPIEGTDKYYMNEKREIKRVDFLLNNYNQIVQLKENLIKPVERDGGMIQMTICEHNIKTTINLKKEYERIFKKEWNEL